MVARLNGKEKEEMGSMAGGDGTAGEGVLPNEHYIYSAFYVWCLMPIWQSIFSAFASEPTLPEAPNSSQSVFNKQIKENKKSMSSSNKRKNKKSKLL
jgi:hypothetical protein